MANQEKEFIHIGDEAIVSLKTLHDVVTWGTPNMIKAFIDHKKIDVDERGPYGMTALHLAASHGDAERCGILLDCGADINSQDDYGRTALHQAAGKQVPTNAVEVLGKFLFKSEISAYSECVDKLLERGADINAQDADGWSALHYAAMHSNPKVAENLMSKGADRTLSDSFGLSAQDVAWAQGNNKLAEKLDPCPIRNIKSKGLEMGA